MFNQKFKRIISLMMCLVIVFFALSVSANAADIGRLYFADEVVSKTSVPTGYIGIYSLTDLAKIGLLESYPADGKYILMNDISDPDSYFMNSPVVKFSGVFDGNGYEIDFSIVQRDQQNIPDFQLGVFGELKGNAVIKNLGVCANIYLSNHNEETVAHLGGIAGMAYGVDESNYSDEDTVIIENCYSISYITASGEYDRVYVGGLVGEAADGVEIKNCFVDSHMAVSTDAVISSVGGVVANLHSWFQPCKINGCVVNGIITGTAKGATEDSYVSVGGIVGETHGGIVEKSCNNAKIEIAAENDIIYGADVGGIVGYAEDYVRINECCNTGEIIAECTTGSVEAAGIVAYCNSSYNYFSVDAEIYDCFNTGNVSAVSKRENEDLYVYSGATGIVGTIEWGYGEDDIEGKVFVKNCYNIANVSSLKYTVDLAGNIVDESSGYSGSIYVDNDLDDYIVDCYSLNTIKGVTGTVGTKLSAEQMTSYNSFVGFDFSNVWEFDIYSSYSYPVLRCFNGEKVLLPINALESIVMEQHIDLKYLESKQLTVSFVPANVEITDVVLESSDRNIVEVDQFGTVKAVGNGTAYVSITAVDSYGNDVSAVCEVTVKFTFFDWIYWFVTKTLEIILLIFGN